MRFASAAIITNSVTTTAIAIGGSASGTYRSFSTPCPTPGSISQAQTYLAPYHNTFRNAQVNHPNTFSISLALSEAANTQCDPATANTGAHARLHLHRELHQARRLVGDFE